jgi:hypothetical protein
MTRLCTLDRVRRIFTRENLTERLREARQMGWLHIFGVFVVAASLAGASLLWRGIEMWRVQGPGGIAGTVTIMSCEPTGDRRESGWNCDGEFTSDDGTVRITRLRIFPYFPQRPTGSFRARVSSPTADVAGPPGGWAWTAPLGGGIAFIGVGAWLFYNFYLVPSEPSPAAKSRRRPVDRSKAVHQLYRDQLARHLRRRRKRRK